MRRRDPLAIAGLTVSAVLILGCFLASKLSPERISVPSYLRCAIQMGSFADTTKGLLSGFNRCLLSEFASARCDSMAIRSAKEDEKWLDSLRAGSVDIVAVAPEGADSCGGILLSDCIDKVSRWAVRDGSEMLLKEINSFIDSKNDSESHASIRERYLRTYDPFRRADTGIKYDYLSPYDEIIRENADSIQWDWRLLAAVIYQESRFRHDVRSRRGAEGLMQMMPHTAARMKAEDLTDPAQSISAGAKYLKILEGYYYKWTDDPVQRRKMTIAAYNAGEGRIRDCINFALWKGVEVKGWDDLAAVIPQMNDDSVLETDTVKIGKFKGKETIAYVDRVMGIYDCFLKICPE